MKKEKAYNDQNVEAVAKAICCPSGCVYADTETGRANCQFEKQIVSARAAIATMPGWRPISEAPKDGTAVLLGQPAPSLDLDEIERRVNAATEGPWGSHEGCVHRLDGETFYGGKAICRTPGDDDYFGPQDVRDGQFIAHARTDVPALIARIRELEGRVEGYETQIESALMAAAETQPSWGARVSRVLAAIGSDFGGPDVCDQAIRTDLLRQFENEGWKLVPVEPTPMMLTSSDLVGWNIRAHASEIWKAMLQVAPSPTTTKG